MINELEQEGTCSIKDVDIDTIHAFTESLEEELDASSSNFDQPKIRSIYDITYLTPNYDYFVMNVETLSKEAIVVEPQYIVHSEVGDSSSGRSSGLDSLNANVGFDNHIMTLPDLKTLMKGSLLELNLMV